MKWKFNREKKYARRGILEMNFIVTILSLFLIGSSYHERSYENIFKEIAI